MESDKARNCIVHMLWKSTKCVLCVSEWKKEDELKGLFGLDFQSFDKLMNNNDMYAIQMGIVYLDSWLADWLVGSLVDCCYMLKWLLFLSTEYQL